MDTDRDMTPEEALAYLLEDGGATPGSRYGRNGADCAPVAIALAEIYAEANGPGEAWTIDSLDFYMGLVVNDSDEVSSLILDHGTEAHRELVADAIVATYEDAAETAGESAGRAAGSWVFDGNTDEETIRRTLAAYDEGDPAVYDLEPAPLSGEWAGESIVELSATHGVPLDVAEIADAYQRGFSEGFWAEVQESGAKMLGEEG